MWHCSLDPLLVAQHPTRLMEKTELIQLKIKTFTVQEPIRPYPPSASNKVLVAQSNYIIFFRSSSCSTQQLWRLLCYLFKGSATIFSTSFPGLSALFRAWPKANENWEWAWLFLPHLTLTLIWENPNFALICRKLNKCSRLKHLFKTLWPRLNTKISLQVMGFCIISQTPVFYLSVLSCKYVLPVHVLIASFIRQISYISDLLLFKLLQNSGIQFGNKLAVFY